MKKIILISLLAIFAVSAFAQGTISIGNGTTTTRFPIYGPQVGSEGVQTVGSSSLSHPTGTTVYTGGLLSGTRYRIEFWAGPSSATDFSGLSLITTTTFRTASNPFVLPNGITTSVGGSIPGVPADAQAKLAVRVWDTLSEVGGAGYQFAGIRGQSPTLSLSGALGGGVTTPPAWVGQSFSLTGYPPSTAPTINTHPASASITEGESFNLNVVAGGSPTLSYQWRKEGLPLSGATTSMLSFTNVSIGDAGNYDVVVGNYLGSTTSSIAVLQVLPTNAPSIRVNNVLAVGSVTVGVSATIATTGGFPGGLIFYSLDGSPPTTSSFFYNGPLILTTTATIRAMSLSADFLQTSEAPAVDVVIVPVYNLTTSVTGSGSISANPSTGPHLSNSVVSVTAIASTNWAFDHWAGDLSGSANPTNLTMNGARSVQAVFVETAYPLTVTVPGGGSRTANGLNIPPNTYYPIGSVVSLEATPDSGWSFLRWQGTTNSTANPLSVSMTQTQSVQAIFGTVVSTNVAGSGSIVMSTTNPVPYGTLLTNTAVPALGYYFVTWAGVVSGTNNPTTYTVTSAAPTVSALFAASPAPTILTQPTSTSAVLGASAAFGVQASGAAPLTYQWRKGGLNIGGATSTNYTIVTTVAGDAGNYDVVVTNGFGSSITSSVATLTIQFPPAITTPPLSQVVVIGSNASFTVTTGGTPPLSYQWRKNGSNIGGAIATNYNLTAVTTNDQAGYVVVVSSPFGAITSVVAQLTVVFPPSLLAQPTNQTVASGNSASFGVTATGTEPLTYQWHNGNGPIADATNTTVIVSPALTNNAGSYYAVVSNPYGQLTSAVATLTVFIPASINNGPLSQVVAAQQNATFSVSAFGYPALNYQWLFNGLDVPGANSSSLVITNVGTNHLGNYWVEAWNDYSSVTSSPAALLMSPSLRVPFAGGTAVWGREATLSVSAWGSGDLGYQWYKDGQPVFGATNQTLVFPATQLSDGGLYTVVVNSPYGSVTNTPYQFLIYPADVTLGLRASLTIGGVVGYGYEIQYSTNLADTNAWISITNLILTEPVQIWVDTTVDVREQPKRFYKVLPQ